MRVGSLGSRGVLDREPLPKLFRQTKGQKRISSTMSPTFSPASPSNSISIHHSNALDLTWGLFMGEHVFPGADASCPLGWISTQVERAGFEIQRVHNMGSHYSRTLAHWLENWRANKDYIVGRYGPVPYRRWEVFLAWSVRAARQGSSTLFMLTLTKAGQEGRRIESQKHLVPKDV